MMTSHSISSKSIYQRGLADVHRDPVSLRGKGPKAKGLSLAGETSTAIKASD
jgi:hypothetical protein